MRRWTTPVGDFDLEVGADGVSKVAYGDGNVVPEIESDVRNALDEHLHGRPASLKLNLQDVTPLAQVTLAKLLEIPFGEVRSYAWVAREIGKPTAIRAVASAVANNPLPVLIPCHRVVRSDGHVGEYSFGGPRMKEKLLQFESVDIGYLESLAKRGIRFIADTEHNMFHLPLCHRGPDVNGDSAKFVELKSAELAQEDKLQPCRRCRPIPVY